MDRRIGLIDRLNRAIVDSRHAGYVTHPMRDLLTQRVFQIVSGHEDGNDANTLRRDPLFKLAAGRAPLDDDNMLACGATFSRLEGALSRKDIYRMASVLAEQFIAGYARHYHPRHGGTPMTPPMVNKPCLFTTTITATIAI